VRVLVIRIAVVVMGRAFVVVVALTLMVFLGWRGASGFGVATRKCSNAPCQNHEQSELRNVRTHQSRPFSGEDTLKVMASAAGADLGFVAMD
jgi:hypothetical protein